jgi:phosphoenolpyruvate carboxykinase (GTP)
VNIYKQDVPDTPQIVFETFAELRKRLKEARNKYGDYISPFDLEGK